MVCAIIKMGGKGVRFGADIPKQYCKIGDKPLFCHLLEKYYTIDCIDKFIIVTNGDWLDYTKEYASKILGNKLLGVIKGGSTGAKSIYNGVVFAHNYLNDDDIILTHDVTNPIIIPEKISEVVETAKHYDFAVLVTEQVHTIYKIDESGFITDTINRNYVCSGYSPEAFKFGKIYNCYVNATDEELESMTSAVALANKYDAKVKIVVANLINLKITYKSDFDILEKMLKFE